ncbi:uncharacterized protein EDB93DRAFT_1073686 [Suillus bovinus]|uniref:uncharacterized protein n=1 Tax=Suillus bovinus TaxID=48563 RepID=UPI001B870367|nr:uncharacterized protein EDB93DRAFT_1073686 [Suillus bovinus]KAG2159693.1 hypothetical protein EDB93DRAFT_1073686 [Suillus bovinus]
MENPILTSLPVELIINIISLLDWRTILVCREVCRLFHSIVEEDRAQYEIELAVSGMVDGPPSTFSTSDRLALLKERKAAWESLRWVESQDFSMMQGHIWELYGNVFAQSSTPDVLHFRQLPSKYRKIEEKEWSVTLDMHVRDFTMDPAQDLLVLIEEPTLLPNTNTTTCSIRIHLRSLTTGDRHRLAPQPAILIHELDARNVRATYTLRVCDNLLGIFFDYEREDADPELTVWDWTTGKVIFTWCFDSEIVTFAFLNSRFLLVGSAFGSGDIDIQAQLYVFDMTKPSSKKFGRRTDYFCVFLWPEFDFWANPVDLSIRSDPSPTWQPNSKAQLPFSTAPGNRLFIITVSLMTNHRIIPYDTFVPADTLLSHIEALSTEVRCREIEWDEWGPTGTRLMRSSSLHDSVWVCYVFGTKFVSLTEPTLTSPQTLEIRDFNQLAIKRDAKVQDGISHHVHDTTVVRKVFANEIHTSLPYRVIKRTLPPHSSLEPIFTAAMCSEDNLILVDVSMPHAYRTERFSNVARRFAV